MAKTNIVVVPSCHPQEQVSFILKFRNSKFSHFIIRHCTIRKLQEKKVDELNLMVFVPLGKTRLKLAIVQES